MRMYPLQIGKDAMLSLALDPRDTVVLQGDRVTKLGHLEKGQKAKARYLLKDGREVATAVEIMDPEPMPSLAENKPGSSTGR
ncbi:MAG: hypothetical protein HYZ93_02655 [Candidatus Omnitrophica bacterium]|nr:hypothetical protein [Candidatus Omnitrophota bacterium]